jgi:hypothetical protein
MRLAWIGLAMLALVVAALTPGVRLHDTRACETVVDAESACLVHPKLVDALAQRADGTPVAAQIREQVLLWQIDQTGAYQLDLRPVAGAVIPAIRVADSLGQTVSDATDWQARTRTLAPGAYRIYVTGGSDTPRELVLGIAALPPATAAK